MGLFNFYKRLFNFGYDAAESSPRRKAPSSTLRSEDNELTSNKRAALISTTRDLMRNFAAARWAVNKHLDYVSTFNFQSRNGVDALDNRIEALMDWWGEPKNCDVSGRHNINRIGRLLEQRAAVDGDVFIVKLKSGHIQPVEGDRIRTPYKLAELPIPEGGSIVDGVILDASGRAVGFVVCKRVGSSFLFDRHIPAENVIHHAYFDRFDQVRGISPLASGLNSFRDVMEASEYALIKAKIVSLFGIKFTRDGSETLPQSENDADGDNTYMVDFGKGAFVLDMNAGDDAKFLESQHPSNQFQDYMQQMLGVALKSLDIPLSFYDESYTNYSGARQALIQYNQSAEVKRNQLRRVLNEIAFWKLSTWVASGLLTLPNGLKLYDLKWEWVGAAIPWIDPLKEISADVQAINAGLNSRQRLCKERVMDFGEVAKELAREQELLNELGLNPTATPITSITINEA